MMSRELKNGDPRYEAVSGPISESECFHWILTLVGTGTFPNDESVVAKALAKYDADVLLDAEVYQSAYGVPLIYMQFCSFVEGIPAKRVGGTR